MIVALVNSMTSLYASIVVFSVLGFKAANDYGRCLDRCAQCPGATSWGLLYWGSQPMTFYFRKEGGQRVSPKGCVYLGPRTWPHWVLADSVGKDEIIPERAPQTMRVSLYETERDTRRHRQRPCDDRDRGGSDIPQAWEGLGHPELGEAQRTPCKSPEGDPAMSIVPL